MAFVSTLAGATSGLLNTWLNRKFISDLEWILQYQKFTTKAIIPPNAGKIGRFNVFAPPPAGTSYSTSSTTALTETYTTENEIAVITATSTDITIAEYGEFYKTSELAMYAVMPGAREKLLKRLKDGAAVTIDTLVFTKFKSATTNYLYNTAASTGGTTTFNTGSVTNLSAAAIIQARSILLSGKVPTFSGIPGHPDGKYAAIISPKGELDIVTETTTGRTTWTQAVVNVAGALGQTKWVEGYIGTIYGVATYVTHNYTSATAYTASSTGDISIVCGDGAVGAVGFKDMEPSIVINDVNSPFKNVDSVAWHVFFGTGLIDGGRIVKMYSAT
jgi:N4-gp56 family major capsid protein